MIPIVRPYRATCPCGAVLDSATREGVAVLVEHHEASNAGHRCRVIR